jgi:ABC-type transport system involved in cytochrome bd biosynthesis fused ATPase/permease subunit
MVSYEAWGTLYLRLVYRPRLVRLAVSALGIALALLLHPFAAAVAIGGLLAILLLEGWIFARKVRRALTEDPKEGSHG